MISTSDIAELIKHPELTIKHNYADLAEIRNKFPYCSSLHLLYLKSLALTNDIHFESHLRYAAAHVMDRERMYYFIHSSDDTKLQTEDIGQAEEIAQSTNSASESLSDESSQIVDQKTKVEALSTFIEKTVDEDAETSTEIKKTNLLETAPDLIDIAYSEDLTSEIEPVKHIEEFTTIPEIRHNNPTEPVEFINESANTIAVAIDLSKLSFIEWLQYKQTHLLPESQVSGQPEITENKTTEVPTNKDKKPHLSRADVDALLNKFIKEEPSMPRPQATFFSPTKTAKQSVEESPDLVTETLAKIYVLQKNYSKAIQAYEQLSLVYPEKKTFFASRIQKIKEEQNKQ